MTIYTDTQKRRAIQFWNSYKAEQHTDPMLPKKAETRADTVFV